jgi:beta-glucosidase
VPRAGIRAIMLSDGPHGLRTAARRGRPRRRLRQPAATCFPTASRARLVVGPRARAPVGEALGEEARRRASVVLGPGINIKRSPLCGRNFEYFSEDPLAAGVLGAALVEGLQSQGVGASVKHFAANNQETDRLRCPRRRRAHAARDLPARASSACHAARPWTVMCAYNKAHGVYASEHHGCCTRVCATSGASTGLVLSTGARSRRVAAVARGPGPRDAARTSASATPRSSPRALRCARRGAARPGGRAGASTRRPARAPRSREFDVGRPPRAGPSSATSAPCCSRTTPRAAARAAAGTRSR